MEAIDEEIFFVDYLTQAINPRTIGVISSATGDMKYGRLSVAYDEISKSASEVSKWCLPAS